MVVVPTEQPRRADLRPHVGRVPVLLARPCSASWAWCCWRRPRDCVFDSRPRAWATVVPGAAGARRGPATTEGVVGATGGPGSGPTVDGDPDAVDPAADTGESGRRDGPVTTVTRATGRRDDADGAPRGAAEADPVSARTGGSPSYALVPTVVDIALLVVFRQSLGWILVLADLVAIGVASVASYVLHRRSRSAATPTSAGCRCRPRSSGWRPWPRLVDVVVLRALFAGTGFESTTALVEAKVVALVAAGAVRVARLPLGAARRADRGPRQRWARPPAPGDCAAERGRAGLRRGRPHRRAPCAGLRDAWPPSPPTAGSRSSWSTTGPATAPPTPPWPQGPTRWWCSPATGARGRRCGLACWPPGAARWRFTDADLAYGPDQVRRVLAAIEDGWDVAIGDRGHPSPARWSPPGRLRALGSRAINRLGLRGAAGSFRDTQCGLKGVPVRRRPVRVRGAPRRRVRLRHRGPAPGRAPPAVAGRGAGRGGQLGPFDRAGGPRRRAPGDGPVPHPPLVGRGRATRPAPAARRVERGPGVRMPTPRNTANPRRKPNTPPSANAITAEPLSAPTSIKSGTAAVITYVVTPAPICHPTRRRRPRSGTARATLVHLPANHGGPKPKMRASIAGHEHTDGRDRDQVVAVPIAPTSRRPTPSTPPG